MPALPGGQRRARRRGGHAAWTESTQLGRRGGPPGSLGLAWRRVGVGGSLQPLRQAGPSPSLGSLPAGWDVVCPGGRPRPGWETFRKVGADQASLAGLRGGHGGARAPPQRAPGSHSGLLWPFLDGPSWNKRRDHAARSLGWSGAGKLGGISRIGAGPAGAGDAGSPEAWRDGSSFRRSRPGHLCGNACRRQGEDRGARAWGSCLPHRCQRIGPGGPACFSPRGGKRPRRCRKSVGRGEWTKQLPCSPGWTSWVPECEVSSEALRPPTPDPGLIISR